MTYNNLTRDIVFLLSVFSIGTVNAGWYVGTRYPADTIKSSNVILTYLNPETSVTIPSFQGKGMYFIAVYNVTGDSTDPHFTWTYVSMPYRVSLSSRSYIEFFGLGSGYKEIGVRGDQRIYSQEKRRDWLWGTNGEPAYTVGSVSMYDTWSRPQLIVKARLIDGGDLAPGLKTVTVPLRIAQVAATNDASSKNDAVTWANGNLYKTPYVSTNWIIETAIKTKCWVDNVDIDLTFGRISKSNIEGKISSQKTLNITCNTPANVNIDLVPVAPLLNISKGATSCGEGLACIVEFDGKQDSVKYSSLLSKSISIQSRLKIIDLAKIKEGKFRGNAILRVVYD